MITPITINYLGEPDPRGGRAKIEKSIDVSCLWSTNLKKFYRNERIMSMRPIAAVTILFEDSLDVINPEKCTVAKDGIEYTIVSEVMRPLDGVGLDSNYSFVVALK